MYSYQLCYTDFTPYRLEYTFTALERLTPLQPTGCLLLIKDCMSQKQLLCLPLHALPTDPSRLPVDICCPGIGFLVSRKTALYGLAIVWVITLVQSACIIRIISCIHPRLYVLPITTFLLQVAEVLRYLIFADRKKAPIRKKGEVHGYLLRVLYSGKKSLREVQL